MQTYPIDHFSQTEQEGGFWLICLQLPSAQNEAQKSSPLFNVKNQFRLSNCDVLLSLFQHTPSDTQHHLQFLSEQPVSITEQSQLQVIPSAHQPPIQIKQTENLLFLGSGLHIANIFYLAKQRSAQLNAYHGEKKGQTLALLHHHQPFPFQVKPALFMTQHLPPEAIGCSTLLEDRKITNRLANELGIPGCFEGDLSQLFDYWLQQTNQNTDHCESWHIIICAPSDIEKKCLTVSQPYGKANISSIF